MAADSENGLVISLPCQSKYQGCANGVDELMRPFFNSFDDFLSSTKLVDLRRKEAGSEIATDWSPTRPKIRCWRPEI